MNKNLPIKAGMALMLSAFIATKSQANILLAVDLTVIDQVTITATTGNSAVTASEFVFIGFYLQDFLGATPGALGTTLISGDLTSFENTSNDAPALFRAVSDPGLNVFNYTNDGLSTFTASSQAFSGSATWSLDSAAYTLALGNAVGGDIYFAADEVSVLPFAQVLGTWTVVPEPSTYALLTGVLALGFVALRRRRKNRRHQSLK